MEGYKMIKNIKNKFGQLSKLLILLLGLFLNSSFVISGPNAHDGSEYSGFKPIQSFELDYEDLIAARDFIKGVSLSSAGKALAEKFHSGLSLHQKIETFFGCDEGNYVVDLKVDQIVICIQVDEKEWVDSKSQLEYIKYTFSIYDLIEEEDYSLLRASSEKDGNVYIDTLHGIHGQNGEKIGSIRGSLLMEVFDSLCYLLGIKKVTLCDASKISGFFLGTLLPYVSLDHKTWYGKFGFVVDSKSVLPWRQDYFVDGYNKVIGFLVNRTIGEIVEDFKGQEEVVSIFRKYHNEFHLEQDECELESCCKTISQLARHIYLKYRDGDKTAEFDLRVLYDNCLNNYKAENITPEKLEHIEKKLRSLHILNFVKYYFSADDRPEVSRRKRIRTSE
jgi:hypothetical protein